MNLVIRMSILSAKKVTDIHFNSTEAKVPAAERSTAGTS